MMTYKLLKLLSGIIAVPIVILFLVVGLFLVVADWIDFKLDMMRLEEEFGK